MNAIGWYLEEVGREIKIMHRSEGWKGKVVGCLCVAGTAVVIALVLPLLGILRLLTRPDDA